MTVTSPQAALHETPRSGFRRAKHRARVVRWTMLVALVLLLEAATRTGWIDRNQMVAPSEILAHVAAIIPSTHFVTDLTRTSVTILAAFALGVLGGVPLGVLLWRVRHPDHTRVYARGDVFDRSHDQCRDCRSLVPTFGGRAAEGS